MKVHLLADAFQSVVLGVERDYWPAFLGRKDSNESGIDSVRRGRHLPRAILDLSEFFGEQFVGVKLLCSCNER